MGYPLNDAGSFYLDTDASGTGIGAVLSQIQSGWERVIAYASRGMNKAEKNYCITEQELLAVVYFIQYFRQYLLGRHFVVRMDGQALVWLFKLKEPSGKIARWLEILATYNFEIEYHPGKKMAHADALSRCLTPKDCQCCDVDMSEPLKCGPCSKCTRRAELMVLQQSIADGESESPPDDEGKVKAVSDAFCVRTATDQPQPGTSASSRNDKLGGWCLAVGPRDLAAKQLQDLDLELIIRAKISNRRPAREEMESKSPACRHYWILWESLFLKEGVLCKAFSKQNNTGEFIQVVVPRHLRSEILNQMHSSVLSGHLGARKTKEKLSQRYHWYIYRQIKILQTIF